MWTLMKFGVQTFIIIFDEFSVEIVMETVWGQIFKIPKIKIKIKINCS